MILLNSELETGRIVVTLWEKVSIAVPYFIFVFTNITTKEEVIYAPDLDEDISHAKQRYNEFLIPMLPFYVTGAGQWLYKVYESAMATTDVTGLKILEVGKMLLQKEATSLTGYETATTITGYDGR